MSEREYTLSEREHQKFMEDNRQYCRELHEAWEYLYGADGIYTKRGNEDGLFHRTQI